MKVILQSNYNRLGEKGDIVTVKPGYGRNYLIPKGIAIVANKTNKRGVLAYNKQMVIQRLKLKAMAEATLQRLQSCNIVVKVKTGKEGGLFGSVTPLQIAKSLKAKDIDVEYKRIHLTEPVKKLGRYQAKIDLTDEINYTLGFDVVED